jgi:hypothetical protein
VLEATARKAHEMGAVTLVEAHKLTGIPGPELAKALVEGRLRRVMVDGIAHIPPAALDEYRRPEASPPD